MSLSTSCSFVLKSGGSLNGFEMPEILSVVNTSFSKRDLGALFLKFFSSFEKAVGKWLNET